MVRFDPKQAAFKMVTNYEQEVNDLAPSIGERDRHQLKQTAIPLPSPPKSTRTTSTATAKEDKQIRIASTPMKTVEIKHNHARNLMKSGRTRSS